MEEIQELIAVLSRKRVKESLIFPMLAEDDARVVLYRYYRSEPKCTDADACAQVYGDADGGAKAKYAATKSQLKSQLLGTVLRLDISQPQHSAYAEANYQCVTKFAQAEVLLANGARLMALELLEQVLKVSREFQITLYQVLSLNSLTQYYAITSESTKLRKYSRDLERANSMWSAERESDRAFVEFCTIFGRTVRTIETDDPELSEHCQTQSSLHSNYENSIQIALNYYRTRAYTSQAFRRFAEAEQVCNEAIEFISGHKKIISPSSMQTFTYVAAQSAIARRRYKECLHYLDLGDSTVLIKGTYNHLLYLNLRATVHLHQEDYQRATEIFNEVNSAGYLENLDDMKREMWQLLRAVLIFATLTQMGTLHARTRANLLRDFSISGFLNSLPVFSTDKQGGNIFIQIIHVLLLISQGNTDGAQARAEALRQYRLSHVRAAEHPRAVLMLKLLAALIKSDYDTDYVKSRLKDSIEQLHTRDESDPCFPLDGMEYIPFEKLWDHCVAFIEQLHSTNRLLRPLGRGKHEA